MQQGMSSKTAVTDRHRRTPAIVSGGGEGVQPFAAQVLGCGLHEARGDSSCQLQGPLALEAGIVPCHLGYWALSTWVQCRVCSRSQAMSHAHRPHTQR